MADRAPSGARIATECLKALIDVVRAGGALLPERGGLSSPFWGKTELFLADVACDALGDSPYHGEAKVSYLASSFNGFVPSAFISNVLKIFVSTPCESSGEHPPRTFLTAAIFSFDQSDLQKKRCVVIDHIGVIMKVIEIDTPGYSGRFKLKKNRTNEV